MQQELKKNVRVITPVVRCSYLNVFTARPNDQGAMKFSSVFIFDDAAQQTQEFIDMQNALREVIMATYGNPPQLPPQFKTPFRVCAGHKNHGIHGDTSQFINCNTEMPPGIVGPDGKSPITNPAGIKSGDYVRATLNAYCYGPTPQRPRIQPGCTFGLGNIQLVRRGDALGSQVDASDEFSAVEGAVPEGGAQDALFGGTATNLPANQQFGAIPGAPAQPEAWPGGQPAPGQAAPIPQAPAAPMPAVPAAPLPPQPPLQQPPNPAVPPAPAPAPQPQPQQPQFGTQAAPTQPAQGQPVNALFPNS